MRLKCSIENLTVALNDDYQSQNGLVEILRLTMNNIQLESEIPYGQSMFACSYMQLDNQMFDSYEESSKVSKYDFPVILIPRNLKPLNNLNQSFNKFKTHHSIYFTKPDSDIKFIDFKISFDNAGRVLESELTIKPFDVYLEDYLVYNLMKIAVDYLGYFEKNQSEILTMPELDELCDPGLIARKIKLGSIDALISLQTSSKIYLGTYKMPVFFDELILNGLPWVIMSTPQVVKLFTSHYLTALLFRAGWLLGSLDLIGTPTVFIQQVSNGVYDFIKLPYRGLRDHGPTGFISGLSNGSLSLFRNLSAGTITSLTSFATFVSRNMDLLSFDQQHQARQEQLRHQIPESFPNALLHVSTSFIISLMGAVGGLAEQPIQSVHNSSSLIKGVSKGIIGFVTKPVGAVAELVNQTGQGILR